MSEGEIMIQSLVQEVSIQLNKISIYGTDEFIRKRNAEVLIREIQSKYFKMFDNIYTQYFEKGISILNLESVACEEI